VPGTKSARPLMLVVAGPPGSGKSTFFPIAAMGVDAFSIDDRCAQIVGSYRAIPPAVRKAVSRECERFVGEHIDAARSFAVETTMRTLVSVRQAERAQDHGFYTMLTFLSTSSADINVREGSPARAGGRTCSLGNGDPRRLPGCSHEPRRGCSRLRALPDPRYLGTVGAPSSRRANDSREVCAGAKRTILGRDIGAPEILIAAHAIG
jgi:hypothetical protein